MMGVAGCSTGHAYVVPGVTGVGVTLSEYLFISYCESTRFKSQVFDTLDHFFFPKPSGLSVSFFTSILQCLL